MSIRGAFNPRFNSGHFNLYGLGWLLQDYHKHKIVSHTGGADGFVSSVTLLPEEELGIVVFTNTDANNFYEALKWELVDAFLNLPYRNYSNLMLPEFTKYQLEDLKWLKQKGFFESIKKRSGSIPIIGICGGYQMLGKKIIDKGIELSLIQISEPTRLLRI